MASKLQKKYDFSLFQELFSEFSRNSRNFLCLGGEGSKNQIVIIFMDGHLAAQQ